MSLPGGVEKSSILRPETSPVRALVAFIESEHPGQDLISIPPEIVDAVSRCRSSGSRFPAGDIKRLVHAIDRYEYPFCKAIDEPSHVVISSIIIHSESCGARHRGFFIIADSLHSGPDDDGPLREQQRANKLRLSYVLPSLLERIALRSETEQTRRWMSVLALELLEGCPKNVEVLRGNRDHRWLGLTKVLKYAKCEILRLLIGSIIRQMLFYGIPSDEFWTAQDVAVSLDRFPLASESNPQWVAEYNSYVQEMVTKLSLPERSNVFLACAASIKDEFSATRDISALLMTISSLLLQIFVQNSSGQQAIYIDIPLENITGKDLVPPTSKPVGDSIYTINIVLGSATGITCYVNANPQFHESVDVAFDSLETASNVMKLLRPAITAAMNDEADRQIQGLAESTFIPDEEQVDLVNPAEHSIGANGHTNLIATATKAARLVPPIEQLPNIGPPLNLQKGVGRSSLVGSKEQGPVSKSDKVVAREQNLTSEKLMDHQNNLAKPLAPQWQSVAQPQNAAAETSEFSINASVGDAGAVEDNGAPNVSPKKPSTRLKSSAQPSKTNPKNEKRSTRRSPKNDDGYDIPRSPTLSPREKIPTKEASKVGRKKNVKRQKASHVAQKVRAQKGITKKRDESIEVPAQSVQPRARRAAALEADKKIRGIDTPDSKSLGNKVQLDSHRIQKMGPNQTAGSINFIRNSTEVSEDIEEANTTVKSPYKDAIEAETETSRSHPRVSSQDEAIEMRDADKSIVPRAEISRETPIVGSNISPNIYQKSYNSGDAGDQNEAPESQMTQSRPLLATTYKNKKASISVPQKIAEKKNLVLDYERKPHDSRPSRDFDPFAAKLSAVLGNKKHSTLEAADAVPVSAVDRNSPGKVPQGAKHNVSRPVSIRKQGNSTTPSLHTFDAELKEPTRRLRRRALDQPASILKKPKDKAIESTGPRMALEKTPPPASRKTPIISFSISGPRNQGIARKSRTEKPQLNASDAQSPVLGNGIMEPDIVADGLTLATGANSAIEQQQQPLKRRKTSTIPEQSQALFADAEPLNFPDQQRPFVLLQDRSDQQSSIEKYAPKASSQTTRVDHNGSPMPTRHLTNRRTFIPSHKVLIEKEDQVNLKRERELGNVPAVSHKDGGNDHYDSEQRQLPALPSIDDMVQPSVPSVGTYKWVDTSKNKKQMRSSPQAPSLILGSPVDHVYHSGELVNSHADEVIIQSNPQDPFVGQERRLSHFAQLLQSASEKRTKRPAEALLSDVSKKLRLSTDIQIIDDPDVTLVESPMKSRQRKFIASIRRSPSGSSSSESPSEEVQSPTLIANENETENTPNQWKKALQPHQQTVLDILTQISHRLLAHLIKSEDAFLDLINDYKKAGTLLIEHLEKEHEAENLARQARAEALKQKVLGLYRRTREDLEGNVEKVRGRTNVVEREWRVRQEVVMAKVDAALAFGGG